MSDFNNEFVVLSPEGVPIQEELFGSYDAAVIGLAECYPALET